MVVIEAGGRFAFGTVPDKILFDKPNMAQQIIQIIEEGMKNSRVNKVSEQQFIQEQKHEREQLDCMTQTTIEYDDNEQVSENDSDVIDVEANTILLQVIQSKFKGASQESKTRIKDMLKEQGAVKFDVNTLATSIFERAIEILE